VRVFHHDADHGPQLASQTACVTLIERGGASKRVGQRHETLFTADQETLSICRCYEPLDELVDRNLGCCARR